MRMLIHIDGQLYAPPSEWSRTREHIVKAARAGGGFVVLIGTTGPCEVFVSRGSSIYAEFVEDVPTEPPANSSFPDFDVDDF